MLFQKRKKKSIFVPPKQCLKNYEKCKKNWTEKIQDFWTEIILFSTFQLNVEEEESSSGYGTVTSDVVKHSNTLEDLDDQDVFKSMVEPSSDKFNGHEIKTPTAAPIVDHATVS